MLAERGNHWRRGSVGSNSNDERGDRWHPILHEETRNSLVVEARHESTVPLERL